MQLVIVLDEQVHNDSLQECSTCCMGLYSITNIDLYMFACTKCELFDDIICVSCYSPCRPVAGFTNLCPNNLYSFISDQDTILRVVIHEISHALVRSSNCQLGPRDV